MAQPYDDEHGLMRRECTTSMAQCGPSINLDEHPRPNQNDVHGLMRSEFAASTPNMCEHCRMHCEFADHPWPNFMNDVHALMRAESTASLPN